MPTNTLGKIGRRVLWISPAIIASAGYLGWLYWLRPRNTTLVVVLGVVVAIFVMGYASFLARRVQRRLDEVQIASQGFANSRGYTWGGMATVLLLMLPPVSNWLIDLTDTLTSRAPDLTTRHRAAVLVGLYFGFMLVVLLQGVCICIANAIWWRRMGGMRERP